MTVDDPAIARMLVLARESRGLTQGELARKMEPPTSGGPVSQGYISKAEAGRLAVTGERLDAYADALGYPAALLRVPDHEIGAGVGLVHHRKKQSVSAAELRRILAVLNLTRLQIRGLAGDHHLAPDAIPQIPVTDLESPQDAARAIRARWGVAPGPLTSVVELLETAGAWVTSHDLVPAVPLDSGAETVPVDAVSARPDGEAALVLLNTGTPAERQRFTVAHELGHMVMHPVPHPQQEQQADQFAAELLMPRRDIHPELQRPLDIPALLELKRRWQVSMWALLRRAKTLGAVTDWQYRTLAVELSSLGYRIREPEPLTSETPSTVPRMIAAHRLSGRSMDDLSTMALLRPAEFEALYLAAGRSAGAAATSEPHTDPDSGATTR
ncbi:helix-turn-helix domain-containing protein [Kribbella sp. DT2]|uniref:helix-turn-helix domain-containing protein n=1 Tax=Kribbella sp. DT2 TaxID=3393427 RepID=UPI003CF78BC6